MYRHIITVLVLVFGFTGIMAQYAGHIYDSQTRQPVEDALIRTSRGTILSDKNGYFRVASGLKPDSLLIRKPGYKEQILLLDPAVPVLNVQLEADMISLNEVRVSATNSTKTRKETPGSVSILGASDISRGNGISLQAGLNTVPGVKMDQSTLSEARISIRGNGVRSTFGIRNIKIYLNEIPVTEADGTTRIEAIDVNSIGRAEIIRGPASSIYGAGTGGVINFQLQRAPYQDQSLELSALSGSYQLNRLATTYRNGGDKLNSYVSYGWQDFGGYRMHSSDMRRFLTGNFQLFPSDKRIITLLLNRSTQHSQIPGAITRDAMQTDPLQANALNLDKAAARYQNWTRVGLGQQYRFNEHLTNSSSVFTYFYDLDHPLPYAYIRNFYQSYGGRTRFSYSPDLSLFPTRFSLGAEVNQGLTKGSQYVNNKGVAGAITSNNDLKNSAYTFFYQSETELSNSTSLTLGLSFNRITYRVQDYLKPNQTGVKAFDPNVSPRIALSQHVSDQLSLHASVSSGFSPPSSSEIRGADGSVNTLLGAEKGINYELNAKGDLFKSRLSYDLALFRLDMRGELIGQNIQQGLTVYSNSGKTKHEGIELALSARLVEAEDPGFLNQLRVFTALTYSDFTFVDYKIRNAQSVVTAVYDRNPLTGIAPWVINAGLDMELKNGVYACANYFYNDKMPLNDASTNFNPAYQVFNARIGYRRKIRMVELDIFGGIDNITNEFYSSITALNATTASGSSPAYFNPSPKRNGYAGLSVKTFFNVRK